MGFLDFILITLNSPCLLLFSNLFWNNQRIPKHEPQTRSSQRESSWCSSQDPYLLSIIKQTNKQNVAEKPHFTLLCALKILEPIIYTEIIDFTSHTCNSFTNGLIMYFVITFSCPKLRSISRSTVVLLKLRMGQV